MGGGEQGNKTILLSVHNGGLIGPQKLSIFNFSNGYWLLVLNLAGSLRKNLLGSKRKANNNYFAFILQVL